MTRTNNTLKDIWLLAPIIGTILFVVLYFVAAHLYPGGSQVNKNAVGFSWINNYWCNLLDEQAINGQQNPAMPVALAGMFILCLTLSFFWILFPVHIGVSWKLKLVIQVSGSLAMVIAFFLFANISHDLVTNLAAFFGAIATVGTIIGLYQSRWFGLFAFGLINVFLIGLNNYVYYKEGCLVYLPVIQKISFASFLCWICCMNIALYGIKEKGTAD